MASTINAISTGPGGIATTADATGILHLQTNGTTAITVSATQVVTLTNALPIASGGTGLTVPGTNGNVLTSDGTNWTSGTPTVSLLNTAVTPGTSGNVLTSNGTNWASTAPSVSLLNTAVVPGTSGNVLTSNGTDWTSGTPAVTLGNNTFTGTQTMSGKSIIESNATVAAHATTMNPWLGGNYVTLTGSAVTFTALTAAPQAGAQIELYMNDAHVFTDGAVFEVDGNANYTATIGDRVLLRAKSTTVFTVHPRLSAGAGGGSSSFSVKTSAYTAVSGDNILANTSAGSFTITLPSSPATGNTVYIQDMAHSFLKFPITIDRNGQTIMGLSENMAAAMSGIGFGLTFNGTTWRIY